MASRLQVETKKYFRLRDSRFCNYLPGEYFECINYGFCDRCEIADRYRLQNFQQESLFDWTDALPQTPKGCRQWIDMPVILKPSAMDRLNIAPLLLNQIMVTTLSPGCFYQNPVGAIDGYLLVDRTKRIEVSRKECYGVPTLKAVERYDDLFHMNLRRFFGKG